MFAVYCVSAVRSPARAAIPGVVCLYGVNNKVLDALPTRRPTRDMGCMVGGGTA